MKGWVWLVALFALCGVALGSSTLEDSRCSLVTKESVPFEADPNCSLRVRRRRSARNVISVAMFKERVTYLDNFERAILKWSAVAKLFGPDWNVRIYTDDSILRRVAEATGSTVSSIGANWELAEDVNAFLAATLNLQPATIEELDVSTWTEFWDKHKRGLFTDHGEVHRVIKWANRVRANEWFLCDKGNSFLETLLHVVDHHENVELWSFACPAYLAFVGRETKGLEPMRALDNHTSIYKTPERHKFFGTMLRFHPMFDPTVHTMVSHNLEFLSGHHEAKIVHNWMKTNKRYLAYVKDKKYAGNYPECTVPNTYFPHTTKSLLKNLHEAFRPGSRDTRHMVMAGLFGAKKIGTERTILPGVAWTMAIEMTRACGYTHVQYGIDEIALNYAIKYLPLAYQRYKATHPHEHDAAVLSRSFFQAIFTLPPIVVDRSHMSDIPPLSPANLQAQPLFKDLSSLYRSRFGIGSIQGIIDPAPLIQHVRSKVATYIKKCDVVCDPSTLTPFFADAFIPACASSSVVIDRANLRFAPPQHLDGPSRHFDELLQGLADFHFCTPLEQEVAHLIRQQLLAAAEELDTATNILFEYKHCVRTMVAKYISNDANPQAMTAEWVAEEFHACTNERFESRHRQLYFLALLDEGITTALDFEGFAMKSKNGELYQHAIERVYGLMS